MTPEKKVETKIRKSILAGGGYITKFFASPETNKGIPDLIGVLNSRYIALEIKRPTGGKPTPVQLQNLQKIANAGGLAIVTNDPNIMTTLTENLVTHHRTVLVSNNAPIDYLTLTANQLRNGIEVKDATHAWTQTSGTHTLQLLKQKH